MQKSIDMDSKATSSHPIPSRIYNKEYFLAHCDGFTHFHQFKGKKLPHRLEYTWKISNIQAGMQVLDVGFGRGETFEQGEAIGATVFGIDFSVASLQIAQSTISANGNPGSLAQADAKLIPFKDSHFDRVLMFDIVEHLHPWELEKTYREAWRVLKPNGQLIIHTAPNLWYYQWGYPLYRVLGKLRGEDLPANPRDRFKFHSTHVNEQSLMTLKRDLSKQGFQVHTWVAHLPKEADNLPLMVKIVSPILYHLPPLSFVFCNDLFAIATKPA